MSMYLPNDDVGPTEAEAAEYVEAPPEFEPDDDTEPEELGRVRRRALGETPESSRAPGDDA
jgi:hypothetical protein